MKRILMLSLSALLCCGVLEAKKTATISAVENKSSTPVRVYDRWTKLTHIIAPNSTKQVSLDIRRELEVTCQGTTQVVFASKNRVKTKAGEIKISTRSSRVARSAYASFACTFFLFVANGVKFTCATPAFLVASAILGGVIGKVFGYSKVNIDVRPVNGISRLKQFAMPRTLQIDPAGSIAIV